MGEECTTQKDEASHFWWQHHEVLHSPNINTNVYRLKGNTS